jgi:hypothetical protein
MNSNSGFYCKASINYPIERNPLTPERAYDLLLQAQRVVPQIAFQWVPLNRPKHGEIFLIYQRNDDIADDGYLWGSMGSVNQCIISPERVINIVSNDDGYSPGDKTVTMTKKRYKHTNSDSFLQLIHYVAVDTKLPIQPPVSFPKPQISVLSPQGFGRTMVRPPGMIYGARPQVMTMYAQSPGTPTRPQLVQSLFSQPGRSFGTPPRPIQLTPAQQQMYQQQLLKQQQMKRTQQQAQQQVDPLENEDLSADEYEQMSIQDVCESRYRRNHEFMMELFSPNPVKPKQTKPYESLIEVHKNNYATLEKQNETLAKNVASKKAEYESSMESIRKKHSYYDEVSERMMRMETPEELDQLLREFEAKTQTSLINLSYEYPNQRQVSLTE